MTSVTKKDSSGNTIINADGTERIYVIKLVHAGSPENFIYKTEGQYRADYLLSNGERNTQYKTLDNGTIINPRNWDMYKDKDLDNKGYIKEVHAMTYSEALEITNSTSSTAGKRNTGSPYWVTNCKSSYALGYVYNTGEIHHYAYAMLGCFGIRPVITMESGVYIASGDGTEESPYVLEKE